jgi:hypothetical protein
MPEDERPLTVLRKAVSVANQTDPFADAWRDNGRPPQVPDALAQTLSVISPEDFQSLTSDHENVAEPLRVVAGIVKSLVSGQPPCGSPTDLQDAAQAIREAAREIEETERVAPLKGMNWTEENSPITPDAVLPQSGNLPRVAEPSAILDSLLREAESRRQHENETQQIAEAYARRLKEQAALRDRLAQAFEQAWAFPDDENRQNRKPCPEGFRRWAERFISLGTVLRECDEAIENLHLRERLLAVACRTAPAEMKFACALLSLAAEGKADAVAIALEKANGDGRLRRFVLWLPCILDNLWQPLLREYGPIPIAMPPDGTSWEDKEQAERALGWQPLCSRDNADADDRVEKSLRDQARALREQREAEEQTSRAVRERLNRCHETIEALKEATYAIRCASDPFDPRHADRVTPLLADALAAIRVAGFLRGLEELDVAALLAHYQQAAYDLPVTRIAYAHARQLIETDPADRQRLAQLVRDAVEESGLRKAWDWVYILLNGLTGQQWLAWKQIAIECETPSLLSPAASAAEGSGEQVVVGQRDETSQEMKEQDQQAVGCSPLIDRDITDMIERDRAETINERERRRQEQEQAKPLTRVRLAVERLRSYGGPSGPGDSADVAWVERLAELYAALDGAASLDLLDRLPDRGEIRQLVLRLMRWAGNDEFQRAVEVLGTVEPLGKLDAELSGELSRQLGEDLLRLLPDQQEAQRLPDPPPPPAIEEIQPVLERTSPDTEQVNGSKPRWNMWAIGLEVGDKWHLFRKHQGEWRQQRLVEGIPKGRQTKLLKAFATEGGFLPKISALRLERLTFSAGEIDVLMRLIKPEISNLRAILRAAIEVTNTKADPLPYDDHRAGWQAEIQIGYAVQEDGEHLGGERRLRFRTREELTTDEAVDR